uniref:2-oxoglutarate-dependent dioxygenase n=1 Tax=Pohlia nutans TaxID=140635 RepID=A0A4P8UMN6_9BRYO|nr:2-oxoglutarate-dependent dioxygenase [Pohlia nutans]
MASNVPRKGALGYNVKELWEAGIGSVPTTFVQSASAQQAFTPHDDETHAADSIPVIDLSGLQEGDPTRRAATLAAIASACQEWGFFQVVNYGMSPALVKKMHKLGREFFDLSTEEKEVLAKDPKNPVGNGYGRQFLSSTNSTEDWQDVFFHYLLPLTHKHIDSWPNKPIAYRETMEEYGEGVLKLTDMLLDVFGELLGLKTGYLQETFGDTMLNARLNFYAACPEPSRVLGLRAHSDPNVMTVLVQDHVGGLQVKKGQHWVNVTPIDGALVVNLADQIQIVSNGKFQSVEHRVVTNQGDARLSIAMFRHASGDANIGPAPELVDALHPALYPTTNYTTYRASFHRKGHNGKVLPAQ